MSQAGERIKEIADAEAARAEAEAPDAEAEEAADAGDDEPSPEPAPEPTPEPAPPAGLSPDAFVELEKASTNYLKRVAKAFGGNPPPPCPACEGLGFDLSGGEPAPDYLENEAFERCEACGGYGAVRTGSHVKGLEVVPCPRCKGAGYLSLPAGPPSQAERVAPAVAALQRGAAVGDASAFPRPGEPGWEPWMGGGEQPAPEPAGANAGG
jgi:hypothetical protein